MLDDGDPLEWIVFLARSQTRVHILEQLVKNAAINRSEMNSHIDASERTITRTLNEFTDRGWVEQRDRSYQLTPTGELIAQAFLELVDSFSETAELSTFLDWFPYSEYELDVTRLLGATVTESTDSEPYAPARRQNRLMGQVSTYRALLPSVDVEGNHIANQQMEAGNLEAELIVPPRIKHTIVTHEYAHLMRDPIEDGQLTLLVADSVPEFHVGLADDEKVQIGVEDDAGLPRALVETTDSAVRDWAEQLYDEYRSQADPVTVADF